MHVRGVELPPVTQSLTGTEHMRTSMFADPLLDQALAVYNSSWEHLANLLPLDELGLDHERRASLDPIVMCYQPEDIGVIIGETFRPETKFSESTGISFSLDLHTDLGKRDEDTDLTGRSCAGVMMSFVPVNENDSPAAGILISCSLNNFLDPFQATTHVGFTAGKIIGQNPIAARPNDIFLFTNELKEVLVLHNTLSGHYRDMLIIPERLDLPIALAHSLLTLRLTELGTVEDVLAEFGNLLWQ